MSVLKLIKSQTILVKAVLGAGVLGAFLLLISGLGKPRAGNNPSDTQPAAGVLAIESKKPEPDEALFLLYAVDSFYRNWPDFQKNPQYFDAWYRVSKQQLTTSGKRAWEVDESIAVLYDSCIELLERYKLFMESQHLVKEAAQQQRESESFWLTVQLQAEGAAMKSGHYAGTIAGVALTLIGAAVEADRLTEAEAKIVQRQVGQLQSEFELRVQSMRRIAGGLASRRKWAPEDSNFDDASIGREKDPFLLMERIVSKEKDQTNDPYLIALDCLRACDVVPSNAAYQRMRADLLVKALQYSNLSCLKQVAYFYSNGPAAHAEFASQVSARAMREVKGLEDLENQVDIETCRVLAFQGKFSQACQKSATIQGMDNDATFLHRKALLQSLSGQPDQARESLRQSLRAGFADVTQARTDKDLDVARKDDPDEFERILKATISHKRVDDIAVHEIDITNTSLFTLTNVKVMATIVWDNGSKEQIQKRIPAIKSNITYTWNDAFSTWTSAAKIQSLTFECDQR